MPIRENRQEQCQQYQDQLDLLRKDVTDLEAFERLVDNRDFKRLIQIFSEAVDAREKELENSQRKFLEELTVGTKCEEKVLQLRMTRAIINGSRDFVTFAQRELDRLNKLRDVVIPEIEKRIELLQGE